MVSLENVILYVILIFVFSYFFSEVILIFHYWVLDNCNMVNCLFLFKAVIPVWNLTKAGQELDLPYTYTAYDKYWKSGNCLYKK